MTSIFLKIQFACFRNYFFQPYQDLCFALLLISASFMNPLPDQILEYDEYASVRIFDRHGYLLREVISAREGHGRWTPLSQISPKASDAAIYAEDRRFYSHHGIDLIAMGRALMQNIQAGKTVSGGSTITLQLVRNLYQHPRNLFSKIMEFWLAFRLEHTMTKDQILEHYLNRIPFGNQTFGIEAASQLYFGKSSLDLSWAEASFLMALPKSPTQYNPYNHFHKAKKRQEYILHRLFIFGRMDSADYQRAVLEPVLLFPKASPFNAPHFTDWILKQPFHEREIHTSLDLPLQQECEKIVKGHVGLLKTENVTNAAVLIMDNRNGQILTLIGSSDYFNELYDGQFNAVFAPRQPGSTLKPFTYALAFDKGYTPASVLPDIETSIDSKHGVFTPLNYDNQFHGPVRARQALACSYNVPAVRLLQDIGVDRLLSKLHQCGFTGLKEKADFYGHGLTLGNGEVTLFELTRAYSIFANHGQLIELTPLAGMPVQKRVSTVFSETSVFWISDILSDAASRAPAFGYDSPLALPFPCAVKTGTSSDYRDNWTVGYTTDYTVGVWVGNFDNKPMIRISGVSGAGPIFRDIMLHLYQKSVPPSFSPPHSLIKKNICGLSGQLPHPGCGYTVQEYFIEGKEPDELCQVHDRYGNTRFLSLGAVYKQWAIMHQSHSRVPHSPISDSLADSSFSLSKNIFKIVFPKNKTEFRIDPSVLRHYQSVDFEVYVPEGVRQVEWFLNNRPYGRSKWPFKISWNLERGNYHLKANAVLNGKFLQDQVGFTVTD